MTCMVEDCTATATVRVVPPTDRFDLKLVCWRCRDELEAVYGWEALR